MLEYTFFSALGLLIAFTLNYFYNPFFRNKKVFITALAFAGLVQLLADSIVVSRGFWIFNPVEMLGVFVPIIPLENLFFGFALFLFTIVVWETWQK